MIIPAIIPKSREHLLETWGKVNFAPLIQIDLVDGKFDDDISWPYEPQGEVSELSGSFDGEKAQLDLMVNEQLRAAKAWRSIGVRNFVFHLESKEDKKEIVSWCRAEDVRCGFALNNDTSLEALYPFIEHIDFIQLMGIKEIGSQGQPFDFRVLERAITIRSLYPNIRLAVDGGVSADTIAELKESGIDDFVSGSYILKAPDQRAAYQELLKIADTKEDDAL